MATKQLIRVYFRDKTFKSFAVETMTTAGMICQHFVQKLTLPMPPECFVLKEVCNGSEREMESSELLYPLVQRWRSFGWTGTTDDRFYFLFTLTEAARSASLATITQKLANPGSEIEQAFASAQIATPPASGPATGDSLPPDSPNVTPETTVMEPEAAPIPKHIRFGVAMPGAGVFAFNPSAGAVLFL